MRVAIYTRVSTDSQSVYMQLSDLRQYASQRDFEIFREYCDVGFSGSKDSRPELDALMNDVCKGKVDVVLVWKFDRFARSVRHLINALHEFNHLGVEFISYTENIDTSSPTGKVLFTIISAMSEFERELIRERVKAGLNRAKQKGIKLGRPKKEIDPDTLIGLRNQGLSLRKIGKRLGVSAALVYKTLQNLSLEKPLNSSLSTSDSRGL